MNKGQLIAKMAADAKVSKAQAGAALDSFIHTTMSALKKGRQSDVSRFWYFQCIKTIRTKRQKSANREIN